MRERGATLAEVQRAVRIGNVTVAKFGRSRFRRVDSFNSKWNGKYYAHKQIDAFAAKMGDGWLVVTVVVKYF
jgi:hypothetical protein